MLTFVSPDVIMVTQKEVNLMSPRTGRPTADPKRHETRIRMSDEDIRKLEVCCIKTGLTRSEVIRRGIQRVYEEVK